MRPGRHHSPFAALLLGLSLWSALPSLEWCPFAWEACAASCSDAEVLACGTPLEACDAGSVPACEAPRAGTCAPAGGGPAGCDATPDPIPFGDRAYCVHPPLDGVLAPTVAIDPPAAAPAPVSLAPRVALQPPAAAPVPPAPAGSRPPPLADPHAPPPARAPPLA